MSVICGGCGGIMIIECVVYYVGGCEEELIGRWDAPCPCQRETRTAAIELPRQGSQPRHVIHSTRPEWSHKAHNSKRRHYY
jgi:hypothetical protein